MTSIIHEWNMIKFDLELLLDQKIFEKGWFSKKDLKTFSMARETLKRRIRDKNVPIIPVGFEVVKDSAHIYAEANPEEFKKLFGDNVKWGVYLTAPSIPIDPLGLHKQWYQTGNLTLPEDLSGLVRSVKLMEPKKERIDLYKPKSAREYEYCLIG